MNNLLASLKLWRKERKGESYNCPHVANFFLAFPFHHIDGEQVVSFCCELSLRFPHVKLAKTGDETIQNFKMMRAKFIEEGFSTKNNSKRIISTPCDACHEYSFGKWKNQKHIQMVHLSMTPAPCQSKCSYCEVIKMHNNFHDPSVQESYRRVFDTIDCAEADGLISPTAEWMISSGEICIHPFKDRILDLVQDKKAIFFTNGFLFDERIGYILSSNPNAGINISIDSGTPETWHKIKGVDNFSKVVNNLSQYRSCSIAHNQIILKYILLHGINDTYEDFSGIISIMHNLNIPLLIISRERRCYDRRSELIKSAGKFVKMLSENSLGYTLHSYSSEEEKQIINIAQES